MSANFKSCDWLKWWVIVLEITAIFLHLFSVKHK